MDDELRKVLEEAMAENGLTGPFRWNLLLLYLLDEEDEEDD